MDRRFRRFEVGGVRGCAASAAQERDAQDGGDSRGGEQDRAQGQGPGPGRTRERRVGGGVLQRLGNPAGGGHIPGARDVTQRAVEGEAGLLVEIDRRQPLGQGEPVGGGRSGGGGAGNQQPVQPGRGGGQVRA